jgi:hypothetical protein
MRSLLKILPLFSGLVVCACERTDTYVTPGLGYGGITKVSYARPFLGVLAYSYVSVDVGPAYDYGNLPTSPATVTPGTPYAKPFNPNVWYVTDPYTNKEYRVR